MTTTPILSDKSHRLIANLKMAALAFGMGEAKYDELYAAQTELIEHISELERGASA